jgi:hypothetical protein
MSHAQYFLSMRDIPLTPDEYAQFPSIDDSQFVIVATANGRLLVRGIIDPEAPFTAILAYLTATERDPLVLMALNPDATDYPSNEGPLFTRRYDDYLAFFPDGSAQNTGGGWRLPGDETHE